MVCRAVAWENKARDFLCMIGPCCPLVDSFDLGGIWNSSSPWVLDFFAPDRQQYELVLNKDMYYLWFTDSHSDKNRKTAFFSIDIIEDHLHDGRNIWTLQLFLNPTLSKIMLEISMF